MTDEPVIVNTANEAASVCPRQARPAKTTSEQIARLGKRLSEKGINPVFALVIYSFDCRHNDKDEHHVDSASTGVLGLTPYGKTIAIKGLEQALATLKAGLE